MARPLIERAVQHALTTRAARIPDATRATGARLLLDTLAVGQAGRGSAESAMALEAAVRWGGGDEVRAWAGGPPLPAGSAAFVNAHQVHTLEWDAIHEGAVVHPMTVVVPTLFAFVARESRRTGRRFSGADLLGAVLVGVDVAAGLGAAATGPIRFFRPAVCGAMGAVAGLVALDRPGAEQAAAAFGIAYGSVSGTMQPHTEGSPMLAAQCGLNARAALHAYDLAAAGLDGPREVLEGRYGWFTLIEADGDAPAFVDALGSTWQVDRTSIKPFPSGRATHGGLDGVLTLQRRHGFAVDDVERIRIAVPPLVHDLVGRPARPGMDVGAARLCLPFLVPSALRDGTVDLSTYSAARRSDAAILDVASRVDVERTDNPDPNAFDPQHVQVDLRDGRTLTLTLDAVLGSPQRPLDDAALHDKVRLACGSVQREAVADELITAIGGLENVDDVGVLLDLL